MPARVRGRGRLRRTGTVDVLEEEGAQEGGAEISFTREAKGVSSSSRQSSLCSLRCAAARSFRLRELR